MPKAIISFGYEDYVVEAAEALEVYNILAKAERYKSRYRRHDEGGTLHYIWPQDSSDDIKTIRIISDDLYRIAKLAGKPEE